MRPQFEYGHAVRVIRNIRNDGTFPGERTGALLIRRGAVGFVRNIGTFLQDQIIYEIHFLDSDRVVGCRESELIDADAPWVPCQFESRERVIAAVALAHRGELLVGAGEHGEVLKVHRERPAGVAYDVIFGDRVLCVPESALAPLEPAT